MSRTQKVWPHLLSLSVTLVLACGEEPLPYDPNQVAASSGQTQASNQGKVEGSPSGTVGTGVATPKGEVAGKKDVTAPATPPPAVKPPAPPVTPPPAVVPNTAALVQQGTAVFNMKCTVCHGALAQRANDVRIFQKTAAQITAAKTLRPIPHANVVWPLAPEILALEAAFK